MIIPSRTENPNHAIYRAHEYRVPVRKMIGRLVDTEFDLLDAIVVNGGNVERHAIRKTLGINDDSTMKRLNRGAENGLVEKYVSRMSDNRGNQSPVMGYRLSIFGRKFFAEALDLMDKGLVAA